MAAAAAATAVQTSINFLSNDASLYLTEKPYQVKYNAAPANIPISNLRLEKQSPITIASIRGRESEFSFEKNGFTVLKLREGDGDSCYEYEAFDTQEGVRGYILEVTRKLKELLGAQKVQAFQYVVSRVERKKPPGPFVFEMKNDRNY